MAVNMSNRLNVTRVFNISNEAEKGETNIVRLDRIPSQTNLVYKWINVANYSNYPVMIYETHNPTNNEPICIVPPVSMISFEIPDTAIDQLKYVFTLPVENPNYTFITNGTKYTCMVIYSLENLGWNYASGIQMINETNQNYFQDTKIQEMLLNQQEQITKLLESLENQANQIKQNTQGNINTQTGLYFYYPLNIEKIRTLAQHGCATIVSDTNFQFDFTINQTQFELLCNNWLSETAIDASIGNGKIAFAQNIRVEKYATPSTIPEDVTSEHLELYIHSPYNTNPVTHNTSNPITIDNGSISTAQDKFLFDYNNPSYSYIIPDAQNPTAFAISYSIMSSSTAMLDTDKVFMGIRGTIFPASEAINDPIDYETGLPRDIKYATKIDYNESANTETLTNFKIGFSPSENKLYINPTLENIIKTTLKSKLIRPLFIFVGSEFGMPFDECEIVFETATNTLIGNAFNDNKKFEIVITENISNENLYQINLLNASLSEVLYDNAYAGEYYTTTKGKKIVSNIIIPIAAYEHIFNYTSQPLLTKYKNDQVSGSINYNSNTKSIVYWSEDENGSMLKQSVLLMDI